MRYLNIEQLELKAKSKNKSKQNRTLTTIIRARRILKILQRDNFMCVKCKAKEKLTIDHIDGRKFAKHDNAKKYKLDKCQTLCIECHDKKNQK